jgi:hypothetical protein
MHLLVVFDAEAGRMLEDPREFKDDEVTSALAAYDEAERRHQANPRIHVVLLGSDSVGSIMATHGIYWRSEDLRAQIETFIGRPTRR